MKAYFEYEGGTFWALRQEGNSCYIAHGSKYCDLQPEWMLKAGDDETKYNLPPNAEKIVLQDSAQACKKAKMLIMEKGKTAIKQDEEFWRITIEINSLLLFFVPERFLTKELCSLAVRRGGHALRYVSSEMQSPALCKEAVNNSSYALE